MRGSQHQRLFKENIRQKSKRGLRILKRRVRELFTHREGISIPRARHKGQQPLIECAKCDFEIIYFPSFIIFYYLLLFFLIDKGVALTPTYPRVQ